ncbi:MAG: hypothetical protein JXR03_16325 [Cyclobacteriaceae bacterium]
MYSILDSDPDRALTLAKETEKQAHYEGLLVEEVNSLYIQAWIFKEKRQQLGKSFILYLKALELIKPHYAETKAGTKLYIDLLVNTAIILTEHYALNEAIEYYDEAFEIASGVSRTKELALISWNKANLLNELGLTQSALNEINIAINSSLLTENEAMILNTINDQGLYLIELGQFEEARKSFEAVLAYDFKESNKDYHLGRAWHNIGHSFTKEEKYHKAIEAYEKANAYNLNHSSIDQKFITWTDLSEIYSIAKDYKQAEKYGVLALEVYNEVQLLPKNYRIFEFMSTIAFEQADFTKSRAYTKMFIRENDKFLDQQEEIQRTKDQYKMEVLAAGFFIKMNASKDESIYSILLTVISSLFTVALIAGVSWQYWVRKSIKKSIEHLKNEGVI